MLTFVWFFAEFEPCSSFLISNLKTTEYAINVVNIINPITFVTVLCLEGFVFSKRSLLISLLLLTVPIQDQETPQRSVKMKI